MVIKKITVSYLLLTRIHIAICRQFVGSCTQIKSSGWHQKFENDKKCNLQGIQNSSIGQYDGLNNKETSGRRITWARRSYQCQWLLLQCTYMNTVTSEVSLIRFWYAKLRPKQGLLRLAKKIRQPFSMAIGIVKLMHECFPKHSCIGTAGKK